jgi:tetratricopeptide (TPR) repeat protein
LPLTPAVEPLQKGKAAHNVARQPVAKENEMTNNVNKHFPASLFSLAIVFSLATACYSVKTPDLETAKNKLTQVEQKLANMAEGVWIPAPQEIFQPSLQAILNDMASVRYVPPSSPANDLISLAKKHMKAGDFNKAFSTLQEASKLDENNPEPYFWMGVVIPATGGPPEIAIWSLGEAIQKDKSSQRPIAMFAYMQRGIFYLMMNDTASSITDLSECIQISGYLHDTAPVFMQTVYVNRGIAYQRLGKAHEALQDYGKALDFATLEENPFVVKKIQELLDEIDMTTK